MIPPLDAINSIPSGIRMVTVIMSVVVPLGGAGIGFYTHLEDQFSQLNAKIDRQSNLIRSYEVKVQRVEWTLASHDNRLDGQAIKNRNQDARLREIELHMARAMPRNSVQDRYQ